MNARRLLGFAASLLLLLSGSVPLTAREVQPDDDPGFLCVGRILDEDGEPAVGYRAVFRIPGTSRVTISEPSGESGEYSVRLPTVAPSAPVALITPRGKRLALPADAGVIPSTGERMRFDVRYDDKLPRDNGPARPELAGLDRLYLSFVEDLPRVRRNRWESSIEIADLPNGDSLSSLATAAYQLPSLPQVEFGVRLGFGSFDPEGFGEGAGFLDSDLWFRLEVDGPIGRPTRFGFGAVVTLPTGDEDEGVGFDAARTKLFGTLRHPWSWGELSANLGLRINEDSALVAGRLNGEIAPAMGLALLIPVRSGRAVVVVEAAFEGERFEDGDPSGELLGGVNWRLKDNVVLRGALGLGLDDGAPDSRLVVGLAVDY